MVGKASGRSTKVVKKTRAKRRAIESGAPRQASKPALPSGRHPSNKGLEESSASKRIDARIKELSDWRGKMLARLRALIRKADPQVTEEWKWRGVPVWSHDGILCTGETYKNVVKMTFAQGASLADPAGLFNASLEGNTRRAIDFHEGDVINEKALKALIGAAVALNRSRAAHRQTRSQRKSRKT